MDLYAGVKDLPRRVKHILLVVMTVVAWVIMWATPAHALSPEKRVEQCRLDVWGSREGLPGNDITALAQTKDGYIWVGTTVGLFRFDGQSFTRYDRSTIDGLTSNVIQSLMATREGRLWIGTEWDGFGWLDGHRYHRVDHETAWNSTRSLFEEPDGSILIGYFSQHLTATLRYHDGNLTTMPIKVGLFNTGFVTMPNGATVTSVLYDRLKIVDRDRMVDYPLVKPLPNTDLRCMIRRADGTIAIGTDFGGVFEVKNGKYEQLTLASGISSLAINCLYEDNAHRLLVGSNDGLDIQSPRGFEHIGPADGLSGYRVNVIMEDREGNVWVATDKSLNRFADTPLTPVGVESGKQPSINYAASTFDGGLLISTRDGLFEQSHPDVPAVQLRKQGVEGAIQLPNGDIIAWNFHPDSKNSQYDFHRFRGGVWTDIGKTTDMYPKAVLGDSDPLTVIGNKGETQTLGSPVTGHVLKTFGNPIIFCIKKTIDGSYLLGTESGLLRMTGSSVVKVDAGVPEGTHVLSVDAADPHCIWIATDHGLIRFADGKSKIYDTSAGLPDNDLFQVLSNGRDRVWIGSTFGMCSISAHDLDAYDQHRVRRLNPVVYSLAEGVRSFPMLTMPVRTTNGNLWFVGQDGVTAVDPDHLDVNTIAPPIVIDTATVDGARVVSGLKNAMQPGRGAFSIRFAGLSFNAPEKVHYRYRLIGYDSNWVDPGDQHSVSYTNLPPGSYRFEVTACNNDGIWADHPAVVTFSIRPHFYQTLTFRVFAVIGFAALILGVARIRMRQMERHARMLEAKVAVATAEVTAYAGRLEEKYGELQDIQSELEAQNEELHQTQQTLAEANERLHALATTDGLTGLINHRSFQERLEAEWSRHSREEGSLSLVLLDVDNFKTYNDTYGHPAGDEVLRSVGRLLKEAARASDIVARYGGEEFVVVAPNADEADVLELAERLRIAVANADWKVRPITISIGVSTARPVNGGSAPALIARADQALYHSKHAGKNRVTWMDSDLDQQMRPAA